MLNVSKEGSSSSGPTSRSTSFLLWSASTRAWVVVQTLLTLLELYGGMPDRVVASAADPSAPAPPPSRTAGPVLPRVRREDFAVRAEARWLEGPACGRELYAVIGADMIPAGAYIIDLRGRGLALINDSG